MGEKTIKKNNRLIILLVLLFVLCLGAGIYFILHPKDSTLYRVDKYQDLTNWCDANIENNTLNVSCNALLLGIRTPEENKSCVDLQIITREKELQDISICEDGSLLVYSNEVLNYKKLMPITIMLSYSRDNLLDDFVLINLSTEKMDESIMRNIVNEDIANLTTIDPSITTIQNSVDFCPRPETLPTYVTDANKTAYTEYFNKNILTEEQYIDLYTTEFQSVFFENWVDSRINIFLGCESSNRLGYSMICDTTLEKKYENATLSAIPTFVSDWNNITNTESDLISLKNLSLVSDGMLYKQPHANYTLPSIIEFLFQFITNANNNQNVYCSGYKIYDFYLKYNTVAEAQLEQIRSLVTNNLSSASSICLDILDKSLYSKEGLYLKSSNTNRPTELYIYKSCNNLYQLITNE